MMGLCAIRYISKGDILRVCCLIIFPPNMNKFHTIYTIILVLVVTNVFLPKPKTTVNKISVKIKSRNHNFFRVCTIDISIDTDRGNGYLQYRVRPLKSRAMLTLLSGDSTSGKLVAPVYFFGSNVTFSSNVPGPAISTWAFPLW